LDFLRSKRRQVIFLVLFSGIAGAIGASVIAVAQGDINEALPGIYAQVVATSGLLGGLALYGLLSGGMRRSL